MKKIILALFSIIMIATMLIGATVLASAEERDIIPVPEVPAIDRPYNTIEELGIDYAKIDAYFPQNIEIRYEGGKVYVEDFGASSVEIYDSAIYKYVSLELIDGFWTAELSAAPTIVYVYTYETSIYDRCLSVAYYGDGQRDQYIALNDSVIGVEVSFAFKYGNVTVMYQSGNYHYEDRYENGFLDTHGVSNFEDKENINQVLYESDGKIRYCTLYIDGYYHYFPEQGWSSNWEYFVACDAPEGYEDIDETYLTANKPSLICAEAKGDDIVHDMSTAYCTTPSTCKNGCGYTIGEIEHHDWQIVDGKKECSLCDAVFFPEFEFIDRTYNNLEESGFPYDEIKALFPKVLTVKYEDGKYMVKDVGADIAKVYNNVDYKDIELSLVDGWWVCELDEEIYNDESIVLFIYFQGEIDGIYWKITYYNGTVNSNLYLMSRSDGLGVFVYYDDYKRFTSSHYVGDRHYNDEYRNGALYSQEASLYVGEDHVYIEYLADGSLESVRIYIDDEWYYYYLDGSWERGVEELLTPPAGYENADVAYFESILPTTINCAHGNIKAADCENPEYCITCGIVSEGSEPLGHNYVGELTVNNTCSSVGEMTYVCQNDASHVYTEDVAIDENAHAWNEGAVTTDPTCSTVGTKTYTCTHNNEHTRTEDVAIDENAHAWNEGAVTTDPTCSTVGTKTYTCTHNSEHTKTEDVAIDENAHAWNEGAVTTDPTCSTVGTKTYTCTHNIEHTKTEDVAIDENAHAWNSGVVTTDPTCSTVGTKTYTCTHNIEHTKTEDVAIDENAHTWNSGVVTTNPTCSTVGTKTYTCTHNSEHTKTEDVAIDENAHAWNEGAVTTDPTCSTVGTKTFTCTHNSAHTKTEEIPALGHAYDNACDVSCNTCGEERTPAEHYSENADGKCDECGESFKLSGGAIAGIAAGSTAAAGFGGFSIFWFVIKKKKWIDLIGIFKK